MKNNLLLPALFIIGGYVLQLFLPWYSMVLLALLFGMNYKIPFNAFLIYLVGGIVLWYGTAYMVDTLSMSRLSTRIGVLFGNQKPSILMCITGLIGGLSSGLGAMTGSLLRKLF